ncbi:MAG: hypothetical protein DRN17_03385 [Thermoplasmata archaeon]|nr:MAG: hypothetical protein DRN17_03385 [Thermoplasmata archaeon]
MAWLKRVEDVEVSAELEYDGQKIDKTDAYEVKIVDAFLKDSSDEQSKSQSLVIGIETDNKETNRTYFTVTGRDGEVFYKFTKDGKTIKKQHFGLGISNTLFGIALGKEIFDCDPTEVTYKQYDSEKKEMVDVVGVGFPELIGKIVGVTFQMYREIDGQDSKEYGQITHFFDPETGLFNGEEDSDNRKLDKWLRNPKAFVIKEVQQQKRQSSFGKKKDVAADGEASKPRWGRK